MRPGRVIFLLAAIVAAALAIANRQTVIVHFDPITADPGLTIQTPLFVLAGVCILAGILIGGLASLLARHRRLRRISARKASGTPGAASGS